MKGAFTDEAYDTRNIATLDIVVAIVDIQDTPPIFTNLPNVLEINENTRVVRITTHLTYFIETNCCINEGNDYLYFESRRWRLW